MRAPIAHMMRLCTRSFKKKKGDREREGEEHIEGERRRPKTCTYIQHHPLLFVIFQSSSSFLIIRKQFQEKKMWYKMYHFYHLLHRQQPKTTRSVKAIDFSHIHTFHWCSNGFDFYLYMNMYIYIHTNIRTHVIVICLVFICGKK
jgi:hypothetical protein